MDATETPAVEKPAMTEDELYGKWWFRYPMALIILGVAWWLYDSKPDKWWIAAFFAVCAVISMYELLLFGIALAIIGGIFAGIASLSVPAAIVVAGCIIAWAIYAKGKKG